LRRLFDFWAGYRRYIPVLAVMIAALSPVPAGAESEVFPIPEIIRQNVAFWIRIYTEVSLQEGLLHDRDFPQIVYEKCPTGNRTGKARSEFISGRIKIYTDAIANVRDSAPDKWGSVEKKVAEMFKNAPEDAINEAETRIRHQTGQRERFRQGVVRSGMYIDTISAIMKQYGVPDELKYLPHVESSFDATAYSKVGASGLWQFMRSTGRGYMRIDYMVDERSDPIISSTAAAKFLRANFDMLQTWPLAITGYNSGPNGMRRAVETLGTRDIAVILERHESASFKFASRNFYACFLAVLEIMESPEKYLKGVKPNPRWQATSIKLPFAMKPAALCKALGITEQEFKDLNPSFRPIVFKEQRALPAGYAINIPHTIKGDEALASLNRSTPPPQRTVAAAASIQSEPEMTDDGYYKVARGDNLNSIARRLGVPMADLAEFNNITNSSRIYVGQVLKVPSGAAAAMDTIRIAMTETQQPTDTVKTAAAPTPSKKDTVAAVSSKQPKDTVKAAAASKPAPADAVAFSNIRVTFTWPKPAPAPKPAAAASVPPKKDTVKTVVAAASAPTPKAADTVKAAQSSAKDTARAADAALANVAAREAEVVPVTVDPSGKPATDTRFDADAYDLRIRTVAGGESVRVRVNVDENITQLAGWMRVPADDIHKANNMSPNEAVVPGRIITIPITPATNIKRFETNRLQYHMAIEEDFFAHYDVADFERYRVKPGDNLWRICRNNAQIPMWLLRKYNRGGEFYNLQPGMNLWIPRVTAKAGTVEGVNLFDPAVTESDVTE